jgi:hypothetical protein
VQGVWSRNPEGARVDKNSEGIAFVEGQNRPSAGTERRWRSRRSLIEEENRRLEPSADSRSPWIIGSERRSCEGLTLRQRKNSWSSHIGESGLVSVRIACTSNREVRFPDLIGTVNSWRDRWHESRVSGIRHSGFQQQRTWSRGFRDP